METIIIGGGVIGMLTARELAMSGCKVTLFDRQATGRESSWAGGGIISPLYPWRYADSVTALASWGQAHYRSICDELHNHTGIDPEWTQNGLLMIAPEEQDDAKAWAQRHNIRLDIIDTDELSACEPALEHTDTSAIWMPEVAQVRNPRIVKSLLRDIELRGVEIHEHEAVTEISVSHEKITGVQTNKGHYPAEKVIVCAGAWSAKLLAGLCQPPEITPVRGQMILFKTEPGTISRITLEGDRYIIPRRDGRVLFGSTLEQTEFVKETTTAAKEELYEIATTRFPVLKDFPVEHHWAGLRPSSPAGIPYIGSVPEVDGLYVNTGHFRNGVVLGPASCRLVTNLILDNDPIIPPEPYKLDASRA